MAAPPHAGTPQIKAAIRQLYITSGGKLPSDSHMAKLFSGEVQSPKAQMFSNVLKAGGTVHRKTVGLIRREVEDEFKAGHNFVDRRILDGEPRIKDSEITEREDWYTTEHSGLDDSQAELLLLNHIHRGVFGKNLTRVSAAAAKRMSASLVGLDPAAKTFLLSEYAIRNVIRRRLQQYPDLAPDVVVEEIAGTKDLDFHVATKPWQWKQNLVVPYDYMANVGDIPQLHTWIVLLEPLCLKGWESVREWYLFALYNNETSLRADSKRLGIRLGKSHQLPVVWQTILQLAAGWHESKSGGS